MNTRVSFNKQEIKQDKFADFVASMRESLMENATAVGGGILAIILIAVGIYFYQDSAQRGISELNARYNDAKNQVAVGNVQVALLELRAIADEGSGSDIGAQALFLMATANYLSKNYDAAKQDFQAYADKYRDNPTMYASAVAGVAACFESLADYSSAAGKFLEAAALDPEGPAARDQKLAGLRCYLLAGDRVAATALLEQLTSEHWGDQLVNVAERMYTEIQPAS
jgi:tetratricopeptide (TPR) repeat protein